MIICNLRKSNKRESDKMRIVMIVRIRKLVEIYLKEMNKLDETWVEWVGFDMRERVT